MSGPYCAISFCLPYCPARPQREHSTRSTSPGWSRSLSEPVTVLRSTVDKDAAIIAQVRIVFVSAGRDAKAAAIARIVWQGASVAPAIICKGARAADIGTCTIERRGG